VEEIHRWFRTLKADATKNQWEMIHDLTFHNLQYDLVVNALECRSGSLLVIG